MIGNMVFWVFGSLITGGFVNCISLLITFRLLAFFVESFEDPEDSSSLEDDEEDELDESSSSSEEDEPDDDESSSDEDDDDDDEDSSDEDALFTGAELFSTGFILCIVCERSFSNSLSVSIPSNRSFIALSELCVVFVAICSDLVFCFIRGLIEQRLALSSSSSSVN